MCSNELEEKRYLIKLRKELLGVANNLVEYQRILAGAQRLVHVKNADKFNSLVIRIRFAKVDNLDGESLKKDLRKILAEIL